MGAWIEITGVQEKSYCTFVAPLVGAWIEINGFVKKGFTIMSLPSWERGLKYKSTPLTPNPVTVAPLVGAWIEIIV